MKNKTLQRKDGDAKYDARHDGKHDATIHVQTNEGQLIYDDLLGKVGINNREDLEQQLLAAKEKLSSLKKDHIVVAKTRTVKRILDHVKIEGSQNLSTDARQEIWNKSKDQHLIGPKVTRLRDEYAEKNRELSELTAMLAQRERVLYEKSVLMNTLTMKAKKDDTDSQAHVLEYMNRNNELIVKIRKLEAAIYQEQVKYQNYERSFDMETAALARQSRVKPQVKSQTVYQVQQLEDDAEIIQLREEVRLLRIESKELSVKMSQSSSSETDVSTLKKQLETAMMNIRKLRDTNDDLKNQNISITEEIKVIRKSIDNRGGSGTSISGSISLSIQAEVDELKLGNERLRKRLKELMGPASYQYQDTKTITVLDNRHKQNKIRDERIQKLLDNARKTDQIVNNFVTGLEDEYQSTISEIKKETKSVNNFKKRSTDIQQTYRHSTNIPIKSTADAAIEPNREDASDTDTESFVTPRSQRVQSTKNRIYGSSVIPDPFSPIDKSKQGDRKNSTKRVVDISHKSPQNKYSGRNGDSDDGQNSYIKNDEDEYLGKYSTRIGDSGDRRNSPRKSGANEYSGKYSNRSLNFDKNMHGTDGKSNGIESFKTGSSRNRQYGSGQRTKINIQTPRIQVHAGRPSSDSSSESDAEIERDEFSNQISQSCLSDMQTVSLSASYPLQSLSGKSKGELDSYYDDSLPSKSHKSYKSTPVYHRTAETRSPSPNEHYLPNGADNGNMLSQTAEYHTIRSKWEQQPSGSYSNLSNQKSASHEHQVITQSPNDFESVVLTRTGNLGKLLLNDNEQQLSSPQPTQETMPTIDWTAQRGRKAHKESRPTHSSKFINSSQPTGGFMNYELTYAEENGALKTSPKKGHGEFYAGQFQGFVSEEGVLNESQHSDRNEQLPTRQLLSSKTVLSRTKSPRRSVSPGHVSRNRQLLISDQFTF